MNLRPGIRRVVLAVALLLLLGLAWTGLSGGLNQLSQTNSVAQRVQTMSQIAYGLFAVVGVVTTFWGRRWGSIVLGMWAACVSLAAGLASIAWGGTSVATGLLAGGAALLIALAIIGLLRAGARGLTSA